MNQTSRILNVMTGGAYCDTVCRRVGGHIDNGSIIAVPLGFLIDYAFWSMLGEPDHIRGQV